MQRLKHLFFRWIEPSAKGHEGFFCHVIDGLLLTCIVASIGILFAGTFELSAATNAFLARFEVGFAILFTVEYLLRFWTADLLCPELRPWRARWRWMRSGLALVDLLAVVPYWVMFFPMFRPRGLMALRLLRLLRVLRLFKLERYIEALRVIGMVFKEKARTLLASLLFVSVLIIIASLMMYVFEHDAQPHAFRNGFSGIWWAIVTLTTVGYGDIYPITVAGKCLGGLIAVLGIGVVAIPTGILSAGFIEHLNREKSKTFDIADREQLKALLKEVLAEAQTSSVKK